MFSFLVYFLNILTYFKQRRCVPFYCINKDKITLMDNLCLALSFSLSRFGVGEKVYLLSIFANVFKAHKAICIKFCDLWLVMKILKKLLFDVFTTLANESKIAHLKEVYVYLLPN